MLCIRHGHAIYEGNRAMHSRPGRCSAELANPVRTDLRCKALVMNLTGKTDLGYPM